VAGNLTEGIGGALIESLGMIATTMKNDLWPAVKGLMFEIFDQFKFEIAAVLGAIFGFIIVKAIIAALVTAGVSSLLQGSIGSFADSIKKMLGNLGFGSSAEEEATEDAEGMADQLKTLTEKIAELEQGKIRDATSNAWSLGGLLLAGLAMVAAIGALAYGFQQAGIEPTMILTVVGALVGTTFALKLLIEATEGVSTDDLISAGLVMAAAAGMFLLLSVAFPPAMEALVNGLSGLTMLEMVSAVASLTGVMASMLGLFAIAAMIRSIPGASDPRAIAVTALLLAAAAGIFALLSYMGFGNSIADFADQISGINGMKLAADMVGLLVAFTALTALMVVMIPFAAVGTIAFGLISAMYYSGVLNKPGEGTILGIPGLITYMGEAFTMAFSW
ncbi:MAG: hypothetical protein EBT93_16220, partial [Alphaproteobacteria bacterium]|nr:hypothetical protein [Alphaproteobacteria bacterium]